MRNAPVDKTALKRAEKLLVQRREIFARPPEEALNAILNADQPLPLVHSMAPQDLHLLIRDIGPDDAVALLNLANDGQWDYVLDLEAWRQDRLDLGKMMRWLDRLAEADPRRLGNYLYENQLELLTLYLYRNIVVYAREHDQEATEFPPEAFSLDGLFYILIPEIEELDPEIDAARRQGIQGLIEDFAARDYFIYQKIMLETATVLSAEMEEEAYRMRNVRLAERGVPPFHEAIGIYQPLSRQQIRDLVRSGRRETLFQPAFLNPILPGDLLPPDKLLAQALGRITSEDLLDRIHGELAFLGNAVIIADQLKLDDRDDLGRVMDKVVNLIAMGLEGLAGRALTAAEAARWLEQITLSDLFRVGYGLILNLHGTAKAWVAKSWFHRQGLPISFWAETGMGVLGGILLKRPRYYDPDQPGEMYREFDTVHEIESVKAVLAQLAAVDELLEALNINVAKSTPEQEPLIYKTLLLTLWARQMNGYADKTLTPLGQNRLENLLSQLFEVPGSGQGISAAAQGRFWEWLEERSGWPSTELRERLGGPMGSLLREVADELGNVAPAHIDPRYIRLFLIRTQDD